MVRSGTAGIALGVIGTVAVILALVAQQPAPPSPPDQAPNAKPVPATSQSTGASTPGGPQTARSAPSPRPSRADAVSLPRSDPILVEIPKLAISSRLEDLDVDNNGAMTVPNDPAMAGWFTPSPTPGVQGSAVLAGHVTWNRKPAVFFRLGDLRRGDTISIRRADGITAVFTVERLGTFPKSAFPTGDVYGGLDHAGLRLITCGGVYNNKTHRYADNLIIWATMTSHHPA